MSALVPAEDDALDGVLAGLAALPVLPDELPLPFVAHAAANNKTVVQIGENWRGRMGVVGGDDWAATCSSRVLSGMR